MYPQEMRATRDLLRRRMKLVRLRGQALAHVTNTFTQYNLPQPEKRLRNASNRVGIAEQFRDERACSGRCDPTWNSRSIWTSSCGASSGT